MKKKIFIALILFFCATISFAQFPNNSTTGNTSTLYHDAGGRTANVGFVNTRYPDTLATNISDSATRANFIRISGQKGSQIIVGDIVYIRDSTAHKWIPIGTGSGGSGTDSAAYHSISPAPDSSYAKFNKPNGNSTVLKLVYDTAHGGSNSVQSVTGNIVNNADPLNPVVNGISQSQLDDSALAIRGSFYLKSQIDAFLVSKENSLGNPSTNGYVLSSTTGGTRSWIPNGSGGVGTVTSVSANAPLLVSNPTTTPNIVADTSKNQGKLATFNDVLTHKDSSAIHLVSVIGDSLLVLGDLHGNNDTISFAAINLWNKNGNNIYYNNGNVGINKISPRSLLEINSRTNTVNDSSGIVLSTSIPATSSIFSSPGALVFRQKGWNTTTSSSAESAIRFYTVGSLGAGGGVPALYFQYSKDSGNTYTNLFHTNGSATVIDGALQGTSATFSGQVTAFNFAQGGSGFTTTNNLASNGAGQLSVGNLSTYTFPEAVFSVYSNGTQGMLLPVLTSSQRDSINQYVASITITNGGTSYTSPPTINLVGGTVMNGIGTGGSASASFTAVLTGSSVTSAIIVRPGAYFNRLTGVTFTGGGGSGATATLTWAQSIHPGFFFFNSTLNAIQQWNGTSWQTMAGSITGTAAPTTTPTAIGQEFIDTINKKIYKATGTSSSSDWTILN